MGTSVELAMAKRDELVSMRSRLAAGEFKFLTLIREYEDCNTLFYGESYASYIAWLCGESVKTAYERIRTARALASLPAISKLFEEGRITYSKVRLVTRVATPETDPKYAELALHGPVHFLEDVVRSHKKILHEATRNLEAQRYLQFHTRDDGMVAIHGRLSPDEAAIIKKAIDAARAAGADDNITALTEVAKCGVEKLATGDEARLHVEVDAHICCVEGHACARATAERLVCGNPQARNANSKQRRVLKQLQGGFCAVPGCCHRRFLQPHHIVFYENGGATEVRNLTLVCSKHHRMLHEGGFTLTREDGVIVFRSPHGLAIEQSNRLHGAAADEWDTSDVSPDVHREYDPGEWFTTFQNRDYAMQWLLHDERYAEDYRRGRAELGDGEESLHAATRECVP